MGNAELVVPEIEEPLGDRQGFDLFIGESILDGRFQVTSRLGTIGSPRFGIDAPGQDRISEEERRAKDLGSKVYLAHDWETGEDVAVKAFDDRTRARVKRATSELSANIVTKDDEGIAPWTIMDKDEIGGAERRILVSPLAEGGSLVDVINRDGPLDVETAIFMGASIAIGLGAAQEKGISHRDVKPDNVLYVPSEQGWKLADWGIAERLREEPTEAMLAKIGNLAAWRQISYHGDQAAGTFSGSLGYAPPERLHLVDDGNRNEVGDSFSLGITLFAAMTGRNPFKFTRNDLVSYRSALDQVREGPVSVDELLKRGLPSGIAQVIQSCTDTPENRPAPIELAEELIAA